MTNNFTLKHAKKLKRIQGYSIIMTADGVITLYTYYILSIKV
jgi:hypothetical protein